MSKQIEKPTVKDLIKIEGAPKVFSIQKGVMPKLNIECRTVETAIYVYNEQLSLKGMNPKDFTIEVLD